jgi:ABC-type polar amino acid transport system ATPase subunit
VGPSGSGKSTLLRAANNLVPLVSGCLLKFGVPVASWCRRLECDEATRTGTVLQTPSLFGHLTVLRNVEMGLDCCGPLWSGDRTNRAMAILDRMGIADLAHRFPHEISGGQQQRSAIARALVGEPRLLLMDEPLSALDAKSAETVCDVLAERRARGTTIVMASHRLTGCIDACSAKVLMASGRVEDVEWCNGHRAPAQHARATAAGGAGPLGVTGRASAEILRNEELQAWT